MLFKLVKGVFIIVIVVIIENNIFGIIINKKLNINSFKELVGYKYGIWDILIEFGML